MKKSKIVVIGAGISGLSSAWKLHQKGFEVVVLEKNSHPGGRMATDNFNGYTIDTGALVMFNSYKNLIKLSQELEIEREKLNLDKIQIESEVNSKINISLKNFFRSIIFSRNISIHSLFFSIYTFLRTKKHLDRIEPYNIISIKKVTKQVFDGLYFSDQELKSKILNPILHTMILQDISELDSRYLFFLIKTLFPRRQPFVINFKDGIGKIAQRIGENLQIKYDVDVTEIDYESNKIKYFDKDNNEKTQTADIIVMGTPGNIIPRIVKNLPKLDLSFFNEVSYIPVIVAHIATDNEILDTNDLTIFKNGNIFLSINKAFKSLQKQKYIYNIILNQDKNFDTIDIPKIIRNEIKKLYGISNIEIIKISRWQEGTPRFNSKYSEKLLEFLERKETEQAKIFYCGDYLYGGSAELACHSGIKVADMITKLYKS